MAWGDHSASHRQEVSETEYLGPSSHIIHRFGGKEDFRHEDQLIGWEIFAPRSIEQSFQPLQDCGLHLRHI